MKIAIEEIKFRYDTFKNGLGIKSYVPEEPFVTYKITNGKIELRGSMTIPLEKMSDNLSIGQIRTFIELNVKEILEGDGMY